LIGRRRKAVLPLAAAFAGQFAPIYPEFAPEKCTFVGILSRIFGRAFYIGGDSFALKGGVSHGEERMTMQSFRGLVSILAIAIAAVGCNSASAQTLPISLGATFMQNVGGYANNETYMFQQSAGAGALTDGYMTTTAYYAGGKGYVSLSTVGNNLYTEQGLAQVNYWFEVIGPQTMLVPVIVSASGSVSAGDTANDQVGATFYSNALFTVTIAAGVQEGGIPENAFSFITPASILTNTPYQITLTASGYADGPDKLSASVDPTVQLDPSFVTPGYSVDFSQDVAAPPPSPVPLPASVWLLLSAVTALGFFGLKHAPCAAALMLAA